METLEELFLNEKRAPFLFVGSGFTRHYYDTPDWIGMLSKFAPRPFNYYTSKFGKDNTLIASNIASDLNDEFWESDDYFEERKLYEKNIISQSSYLRIKISNFLKEVCLTQGIPEQWKEELLVLRNAPIDGIITTNWDDLIEQIFPKFNKYVGQEELLFNTSYSIGEIYKIHGCMYNPESMILTKEDYDDYNKKYPYLAAKLLTIFVEHPVVFMGYSIHDPNIQNILKSLISCFSQETINSLKYNLILVTWEPNENYDLSIEDYNFMIEDTCYVPCVRIRTHDFKPIYKAMYKFERKIPVNILRAYKKDFCELVYSEKPERKLLVVDDKDLERRKDIEYVCGFGAINKYNNATGYVGLKAYDLFKDLLSPSDENKYDACQILTKTIPNLQGCIPIYKYLRNVGINDEASYNNNKIGVNTILKKGNDFKRYYKSQELAETFINDRTIAQIISDEDIDKVIFTIPYMNFSDDELNTLRAFLIGNLQNYLVLGNNYSSYYRKAACFYDWKKYGW